MATLAQTTDNAATPLMGVTATTNTSPAPVMDQPPSSSAPLASRSLALPLAANPLTEKRVQAIAKELRCLVCQNETIADSNADLAVDLRAQIRSMIAANQSDAQIMQYMTDRYGDFVRYRPAVVPLTYALWFGPLALLLIASFVLWRHMAHRRQFAPTHPKPQPTTQLKADASEPRQPPLSTLTPPSTTTQAPQAEGIAMSAQQRAKLDQLLRSPDHD